MRICITLDDVLRSKTYQFGKIYQKHVDSDIKLECLDLTSGDLSKIFGFKSRKEFEKFLYEDYSFEIFGEAPVCEKMLDKKLSLWQLDCEDEFDDDDSDDKFELILANPFEFNQSIGCTCFFLSKLATKVRKFIFPKDSNEIWDSCDVLITADKQLLDNKPSDKKVIKITTDYNVECCADYTYDSLSQFLDDKEILKKL